MTELEAWVKPKRPGEALRADVEVLLGAHQAAWTLENEGLASERARAGVLLSRSRAELEALDAENRFRGEMDLGALIAQTQTRKVPRWFLYPPWDDCDAVRWVDGATVTFEFLDRGRARWREELAFPNPFPGRGHFQARTILLPARVREQVRALNREGLKTFILFEPRKVSRDPDPPPPEPDPALLVKAGGRWFVVDLWEDPLAEDPRALGAMREFFCCPEGEVCLQPLFR